MTANCAMLRIDAYNSRQTDKKQDGKKEGGEPHHPRPDWPARFEGGGDERVQQYQQAAGGARSDQRSQSAYLIYAGIGGKMQDERLAHAAQGEVGPEGAAQSQ